MAATFAQMAARLIDIYGPPASAVPSKLYGNLMVAPSGKVLVGTTTDSGKGQLQVTGGVNITGDDGQGAVRMIAGNYGTILRNDGSLFYILGTASGAQTGSWNAYRPFTFNLNNGGVGIATDGSPVTIGGAVTLSGGISGSAVGPSFQGTSTTGLISGATSSGTTACCINYAGAMATWNGSNGWNTFYSIITSNGGGINNTLSMNNQSTINLYGTNGYCGLLRGDASNCVGFINQANNAWNLRIYDNGNINARAAYQSQVGYQCQAGNGGTQGGNSFNVYWTAGTAQMWIDSTNIGTISVSSDYRIKHSVVQTQGGLAKVNALRTVSYRFKDIHLYTDDGRARDGFIAHEVAEVIPSAVHGEKDALNADGEIQPQTLDPLPMISVLWNAVQELSAQVEDLKTQIKTMKGDSK